MLVQTRDFGDLTINDSDVINFVQPILGFEDYKKFVFLADDEDEDNCFAWLQSLDEKNICFVLTNPLVLNEEYKPNFPNSVEKELGKGDKFTWLLTVIKSDITKSTVNLKSPIVLNPEAQKGLQVVLEEKFPIRQTIT